MQTIVVTANGTACPVESVPDTARIERRIAEEWQRQAAISLARILLNPVQKGKTYE